MHDIVIPCIEVSFISGFTSVHTTLDMYKGFWGLRGPVNDVTYNSRLARICRESGHKLKANLNIAIMIKLLLLVTMITLRTEDND